MKTEELRITNLKKYLITAVDSIEKNRGFNIDVLSEEVNTYSLDKVPTASTVEKWVTGDEIHKDVYSFKSRRNYSFNEMNNLQNIGFFETFENLIFNNNRKGILPQIDGIERIECLNCGAMASANTNTAEFDIQIQITYRIGG